MTTAERQAMRDAVGRAIHGYACGCDHEPWPLTPHYEQMADAVLDALGLGDDLTAAYRLAGYISGWEPYQHIHPENLVGRARSALEVALTPTEGGQRADND